MLWTSGLLKRGERSRSSSSHSTFTTAYYQQFQIQKPPPTLSTCSADTVSLISFLKSAKQRCLENGGGGQAGKWGAVGVLHLFVWHPGGVDLPQLLAGAAWSQSEGLQENRNMMQNDLLERIEFRTSITVTPWRCFWITSDIRYDVRSTENTGPEFPRSGCAVQRSQESELWVTGGGGGVPWSARQCTVLWERTKLSLRSYFSD